MAVSLEQPVTNLDDATRGRLSGDLTLGTCMNRDWTGVADCVGFTCSQVQHFQQHNESGKGYLFLKTWHATGYGCIKKLLFALIELDMNLILRLVQDVLSDKDYQNVLAEYESLKQENKLLKIRDSIPDDVFYQALYPRPNTIKECSLEENSARDQCVSPEVAVEPKTVYISYVAESIFTNNSITRLAEFLHSQDFKVYYKPFCEREIRNIGGLSLWKEQCIQRSENIIVVCTPKYCQEDSKYLPNHHTRSKKPSEINVDSQLLRLLAYSAGKRSRLISLILDCKKKTKWNDCVPVWVQTAQPHHWPTGKIDLLRILEKQEKYQLAKPRPEDMIVIKPKVIGFPTHRARKTK